jgi:hypothetical protein
MEDEDTHKFKQISHAARLKQPITVRIRGQFNGEGDSKHEVFIQKEFCGIEPPSHILDLLQFAFKTLEILSQIYGTREIPGSCLWTQLDVPRSLMEISVVRRGRRILVT